MSNRFVQTRKSFLMMLAGYPGWRGAAAQAQTTAKAGGKVLIVVAHPDDEYAVAATTYRLVRELGWTADQVVITDGEGGYRYAALAEVVYGVSFAGDSGRSKLAAIRRDEVQRAGKILGIRQHYFLNQRDLGFQADRTVAGTGNWDRAQILSFLSGLLEREKYDVVFCLAPTPDTHAHHRAATLLTLEAVARLGQEGRPLVLGAEAGPRLQAPPQLDGYKDGAIANALQAAPILSFDRGTPFGYHDSLNYQIVVNWLIAEHKSQGLFQTEAGKDELEHFWAFSVGARDSQKRAEDLGRALASAKPHALAAYR